jgi:DDE superfamily endonuclease
VDKYGQTIDFLLTEHRDTEAALRFLKKAIRRNGLPETITIDGSDANAAAIKRSNEEHGTAIAIRQVKYLTGCKFSREPTLLSLALMEVQNQGRVWCRQNNAREARGAMTTTGAGSLPVLCGLSRGLLATYVCMFFHYFNRLW